MTTITSALAWPARVSSVPAALKDAKFAAVMAVYFLVAMAAAIVGMATTPVLTVIAGVVTALFVPVMVFARVFDNPKNA